MPSGDGSKWRQVSDRKSQNILLQKFDIPLDVTLYLQVH